MKVILTHKFHEIENTECLKHLSSYSISLNMILAYIAKITVKTIDKKNNFEATHNAFMLLIYTPINWHAGHIIYSLPSMFVQSCKFNKDISQHIIDDATAGSLFKLESAKKSDVLKYLAYARKTCKIFEDIEFI